MASGMQRSQSVNFSDSNVSCDAFDCEILTQSPDEKLPLKITLTPYIEEDYRVTEATLLQSGRILSLDYRLKTVKSESLPEQFLAQELDKFTAIAVARHSNRFGYWAGILEVAGEDQLKFVTLDYQPGQTATFTVYSPGMTGAAIMTFKPEWLKQHNGELTTKLTGIFASQLTLRYPLQDVIDGDYQQRFERYPERLISHGNFRLYRVKSPEDYTQPKWLKSILNH